MDFMNTPFFNQIVWGDQPLVLTPWKMVGMMGALMFASRWFVQAYYSRKAGRPVTPPIFWIMSITGSFITLLYFYFSAKQDIVGITNTLPPCLIAIYNLVLELRYQKKLAADRKAEEEKMNSAPVGGIAGPVEAPPAAKV